MTHRWMALTLILLLQACTGLKLGSAPNCPKLNKQNLCYATLSQIAPTQMNIGLLAIEHRSIKILEKARENKLQSYIDKRKAPAIKGHDGRFYIIDRHHLASALYYSAISYDQKKILVEQRQDQSTLSKKDFLHWMNENDYLYLKDNGVLKSHKDLPDEISELTNDSHRGLIWLARKTNHLYKPDDAPPYFDFHKAEKVREHIDLSKVRPRVRKDYLPYLEKVSKILSP